jgi:anti-sigma factor RsiW
MDCQKAREGLWPPERPKLVGEEIAAARAHIERCPECKEFFEQDRALLEMYDRLRSERAPRAVREKVFDALAQERYASSPRPLPRRDWLRVAAWPLVAAAALAVISFGNLQNRVPVGSTDGGLFVEDYLRRAVGQDHIETSDADEVRRFLMRELGVQLGPLEIEGLQLTRAEICLLDGRRGAMIEYEKDGAKVSHYLVPRKGTKPRQPTVSDELGGPGDAELPVVTWSEGQVEEALVGRLSSDQLLRLATGGATD